MNKRAICFLVDPYYIDGTAVTLQSIIDIANKDLKYDVFMLHEYDSITETDQIKFLNYFKKYEN